MIQLLYFSQSIPTLTSRDLEDILKSARQHNEQEEITGVLVHGGRVFLQVLEGAPQNVLSRYLRILQDKRHGDVELLRVSPAKDRMFKNWSMAFVEAAPLQIQQINQFKADYLALGDPREFTQALRALLDILKESGTA